MASKSLVGAILGAWPDFRGSMRDQMAADPREERLLFYVFLACALGFVAGLPGAIEQGRALDIDGGTSAMVFGRLFSAIFIAPLFLYGIAALSHLLARLFGGSGPYYNARLALFWSLLVAMPLLLAVSAISAVLPNGSLVSAMNLSAAAVFFWIWGVSLAEGSGVRRALPLALTLYLLPAGLLFLLISQ